MARQEKPPAGTQERVLSDLTRYMDNPDAPMVSHGVASNQLSSTSNMNISPSKMYEDGGHKLRVVQFLAERGRLARMPRDRAGLFESLEEFFTFCGSNGVPPTLGGFAVWNGVSVQRVNQIERDKTNREMSEAITVCKDAIRTFIELCAMDSSLNPIVYFHHNKVYFGAVENQQLTVRVEDNTTEISEDEYRERAVLMTQGEDGVFRPE